MFDDEKKRGDKRKQFIWIYSSTRRSTFCWYELRQIFSSVSSPRLLLKINNPLFYHHEHSLPPSSIHTIIILGTRWMNFRIYVRQNILNFCVGDSTRLSTFVFFLVNDEKIRINYVWCEPVVVNKHSVNFCLHLLLLFK